MKYVILLFFSLSSILLSEDTEVDDKRGDIHMFRIYGTDRLYTGWQDARSFITRLYFNKNMDLESTLKKISQNDDWNLNNIDLSVDVKIATEIVFYRDKYFSVGIAGAMDILMFAAQNAKFHVYDFTGQFTPYVDLWLNGFITDLDLKIRIYPFYHQSTHFVDGYEGEFLRAASYELASVLLYYNVYGYTVYGGAEGTFNAIGNGVPLFKGHVGLDYRYPLYPKYDINLIAGINIAAIYDKEDQYGLIEERWHPAINVGLGVEFYRYVLGAKYSYQRGRGATTYFQNQSFIGAEITAFL